MSHPVLTVPPTASAREVVGLMSGKGIGSVVVKGNGQPMGIVTERDILAKVVGPGHPLDNFSAADIMNSQLIQLPPETPVKAGAKAMIARKGRLLVPDEGELQGIVTASDLVRALAEVGTPELPPIERAMTRRVFSVLGSGTLMEAIRLMTDWRIGSVLVMRDNQPYGIFTERDLLNRVLTQKVQFLEPIGPFASRPLIVARPHQTLLEATQLMREHRVKRLPIYREQQPVGMLTARDIVEAYSLT
jgi:CBS domain-containing protein